MWGQSPDKQIGEPVRLWAGKGPDFQMDQWVESRWTGRDMWAESTPRREGGGEGRNCLDLLGGVKVRSWV